MNTKNAIGYLILEEKNGIPSEDRCIEASRLFSLFTKSLQDKEYNIGWILHPENNKGALIITEELFFIQRNVNSELYPFLKYIEPEININEYNSILTKLLKKQLITISDTMPSSLIILENYYMESNSWFSQKSKELI